MSAGVRQVSRDKVCIGFLGVYQINLDPQVLLVPQYQVPRYWYTLLLLDLSKFHESRHLSPAHALIALPSLKPQRLTLSK